jgi:hypothetical protein
MHDVIDSTYDALNFTVLLGCVWAREADAYAMLSG